MTQSDEKAVQTRNRLFSLRNLKMRSKLLALVALVACTSIATLTFFSYEDHRRTIIQKQGAMMLGKGEEVINRATNVVDHSADQLRTLALSPALIEAVEAANDERANEPQAEFEAAMQDLDRAWINGDERAEDLVQRVATNGVSQHLQAFQRDFPEQVEIFATDAAGRNVAMTNRTGDYLQADEGWWQATYAGGNGDLHVGTVEYDESAETYALNIGVPVRDAQGRTIGVLRGTVDVSMLFGDLSKVTIGETGHASLIDADGQILYAHDEDLLMQQAPRHVQDLLDEGTNTWRDDLTDLGGKPALLGATFMEGELGEELGWMLLLDQDLQELEADLWKALIRSVLIGLGLLLGLLLLGVWVARSITRPIRRLERAAREVAEGDLEATVDVDTDDEIGSLSASFNQMVSNIRAAMEEVQQKNAQAERATREAHEARSAAEAQQAYLARSVEYMLQAMNRFAEGDLTVHLEEKESSDVEASDAIKKLYQGFNRAVHNLREMLHQVGVAVDSTSASASEISTTTDQLATGAQEQSSQSDEVAAAVEQMSRSIVETAENAQDTAEAAARSAELAQEGGQVVEETTEKIREIAGVVNEATETMQQLGRSSEEIGEIVAVIDEIADQTNLLALNAAIEAARAGEHGQGFAVVADEVRELAERTTQATAEIAATIERVQQEAEEAVDAIEEGTSHVGEGMEMADKTHAALKRIVASTEKINDRVAQIASANEEQSATSEQISRNVEAISTVSQQSAAGITQISHSASNLKQLTADLRQSIAQFRLQDQSSGPNAGDGHAGGEAHESSPSAAIINGDGR